MGRSRLAEGFPSGVITGVRSSVWRGFMNLLIARAGGLDFAKPFGLGGGEWLALPVGLTWSVEHPSAGSVLMGYSPAEDSVR